RQGGRAAGHSRDRAEICMTEHRSPVVIREKISRLTGRRTATTLVLDRDFTFGERASFYRLPADGNPRPTDFEIEGRTVRYECDAENVEKWRRAFDICVANACGPSPPPAPRSTTGTRERWGFRKLNL